MKQEQIKRIGFIIGSIIVISLLIAISLPHHNRLASQKITFVYNDQDLEATKNDNQLNAQEVEKINQTRKNEADLSVKIENNLSFSQLGNKVDLTKALDNAVKLVNGVEVKIDDHTYYLKNRQIYDQAMEQVVAKAFPNQESFNVYKQTGQIDQSNVRGRIFTGFDVDNKIKVTDGRVPEDKIINNVDDFMFALNNNGQKKQTVTIKTGETIPEILAQHDLTTQDFDLNNQAKTTSLFTDGSQVVVNKPNPVLNVVTKYQYTQEEVLPFRKTNESTDQLRVGETKLKQSGQDGRQNVTYEVTIVNGQETSQTPVGYEVLEQSVPQITLVGNKQVSGVGTGNLRWPASACRITNGYGGADLAGVGHLAIDIQSGYGSPIYAADNGRVIFSGWDPYGGGNSIQIDHGRGLVTQYNHMMSPSPLRVGQNVEQGQVIGNEGASGLATGPHLHFEVHVNGRRVNPLGYVHC